MKKTAWILILCLLMGFTSGLALASEEMQLFFLETFDHIATNGQPSSLTRSGLADAYVKECGTRNKIYYVDKQTYSLKLTGQAATTGDDVVFQMDMKVKGSRFNGGITLNSGNTSLKPLILKADGKIENAVGKEYESLSLDRWVNYAICLHQSSKSYDVYVDGELVLGSWRMDAAGFGNLSGFVLDFQSAEEDAQVYLDNLRIYSGSTPLKEEHFPKQAYSEEVTEYTETVKEAGNTVISNYTFDTKAGSVAAKSNSITQETEDENSYMHYLMAGSEDAYIDFSMNSEFPYVVYEADVRSSNMKGTVQLFTLRYTDGRFQFSATISPGGNLSTSGGVAVGTLGKKSWYRVAAVYRYSEGMFDFYLDGECVAKDQQMTIDSDDFPTTLRFHVTGEQGTDFDLDNVRIYEGKEPRVLEEEGTGSEEGGYDSVYRVWPQNSVAEGLLGSAVAFQASNGALFCDNKKSFPENGAFIENKINYLPLRLTAELMGSQVTWDEETQRAVVDGNAYFRAGESSFLYNGNDISLSAPVLERNGALYIPAETIGKDRLFGKAVYENWYGLVVLDPKKEYTEEEGKTMAQYLMFERPRAQQILQDFQNSNMAGQHPRVLVTQSDFDRIKSLIGKDELVDKLYDYIKKTADSELDAPACEYVLPDGVRLLATSRAVKNSAEMCGFMYHMTGDPVYAERVWTQLESAANFPDWNPSHYLDTGEMAAAFAIGYDWLYDYWTEEQREFLRNALKKHMFDAYFDSYQNKSWWTTLESNWTYVCNGGGIMGALAVMDEMPEESAALIENALRCMEGADLRFAPDGGWYEGPGYWGLAMDYYVKLASTMFNSLGKDYGMTEAPGIKDTLSYMLYMHGAKYAFSYSDMSANTREPIYQSMWLAKRFQENSWATLRSIEIMENKSSMAIYDILWYDPAMIQGDGEITLPLDAYFRSAEVASSRSSWTDSNMLYLGYKGGYARQSHGQLDYGTFVFDLNGARWATDWGSEDYNLPGYSSWDPAYCYLQRAEGHNTLVINPREGENDQDTYAQIKITRHEQAESGSIGVVDLTAAYPEDVNAAHRGFKVDDMRSSVVIRDEVEFKEADNTVYWFMHTPIVDPEQIQINGNTAILTADGGQQLYFEFLTDAEEAELVVMDSKQLPTSPTVPGQKVIDAKKLAIVLKAGKTMNLTVKMYDADNVEYISPIDDTPIDDWKLEEGSIPQAPALAGLFCDGSLVEDFSAQKTDYTIIRNYDEPEAEITAQVPEGVTLERKDSGDNIQFTLRLEDDPAVSAKYRVQIKKIPYILENLDEYERLKPVKITASRVPQPENPPENVDDGDVNTRFAVDGDGEWIQLDYGQVIQPDAYAISYYQGTTRDSYYDILISEDGQNFTTIFEGQTSGLTNDYELFNTPGLQFRYLRLVGHKNSVGAWNSPTEITVLKKK